MLADVLPASAVQTSGEDRDAARCLQCETALTGPYCHACGQHESVAERLTFRSLWHDFRIRRLNLDRGLLRTLVDLVRDPGRVARTFVEGKRQTYTHPITLLFILYAGYAVVYGVFEEELHAMMRAQMESQMGGSLSAAADDPVVAQAVVAMETTVEVLFTYGAYFTLLIILPFAAALRWLLADRGRTVAECAVFAAYVEAAVVFPSMAVFVPLSVWLGNASVSSAGLVLYLVYAAVGARSFFDRRPGSMALAVLSVIIGLVVYLSLFIVGAGVYGFWVATQAHAG